MLIRRSNSQANIFNRVVSLSCALPQNFIPLDLSTAPLIFYREFQLGVFGGALYGASHTISGHSLDNIKARLQLDPNYSKLSAVAAARKIVAEHGLRGLFLQGVVPPLLGSSLYRCFSLFYEMIAKCNN